MNKRSGFINIYPNPTNDEINIELRGTNAFLKQISIYDATGKLLISTPIYSEQNVNIDLSNSLTESGFYLIDVTLDNGLEESRKILYTKSYY